uniref:Uncharacterized protein n=3 Tax=Vibrio TaxID=662 RepID=A0A0H4A1U8_9VIBR|nr:hypothetical protein [Vibrio crassostreae]
MDNCPWLFLRVLPNQRIMPLAAWSVAETLFTSSPSAQEPFSRNAELTTPDTLPRALLSRSGATRGTERIASAFV